MDKNPRVDCVWTKIKKGNEKRYNFVKTEN